MLYKPNKELLLECEIFLGYKSHECHVDKLDILLLGIYYAGDGHVGEQEVQGASVHVDGVVVHA